MALKNYKLIVVYQAENDLAALEMAGRLAVESDECCYVEHADKQVALVSPKGDLLTKKE